MSKKKGFSKALVKAEPVKVAAKTHRQDGWYSAVTGIGVIGQDKRESVGFISDVVNDATARDLWQGDDISARIIETLPNECLRQGFAVTMDDKEQAEALTSRIEELNTAATFVKAKQFERAYGGAAIMPLINDG